MARRRLALLALFFLLVGALGVQVYRSQLQLAKTREQDQLLSIARLKVEQIAAWRQERLGDAGVLSANPLLLAGFRDWLNGTASPAVQAGLMGVIEALRSHYGYRDYLLVDATGRVRLASGQPSAVTLEGHAQAALAAVRRSHAPFLTDLHTDIDYPYPHLGLVVPLWQGDAPAGALILLVDAQKTLYPLLQTWPVPSATAETLLVRREGDEALFLNELRHQADTALRLRLPLTRADLPSTQAFLGARGVVEGRDYRGVPVLAAAFPVPDTPWFVIAKIDRQELYAGVWREAALAGGGLLALLALAGTALGLAWQRRERQQTQWLLKAQALEHESLGRFRNLFEQSRDGILLLTPEHRVLDANPAALALLGYGREALAGLSLPDLLVPDEHARLAAGVARMMAGEPHQGEWRHRRADGALFLAQVTSQRLDAGHYYATLRDVTRQRELEAAQAENTRRLQLILTNATDGLWDWNLLTGEDFHSPRYRELLGYGPGELPDTFASFKAIIHPDDLPRVRAAYQAHMERREPYQVELRLRMKQGDYRWFVSRGQAEWDADGQPLRMAGFITDITERKHAERELRLHRALVDHNQDVVCIIRPDASLHYVNAAACRVLEYTREELLGHGGMTVADIDPLYGPETWQRHWRELKAAGSLVIETLHRSRSGRVFPVEAHLTFIEHEGQEFNCAITRDITERRRAEQALRDSEFRWQFAIEGAGDGLWDWDVASGICFYSRQWKAMIGCDEDEIGTSLDEWTQRVHPEDLDHVQATWQGHLDGTVPQHVVEYRLRHKDGSWVWILGRGQVSERDASGQPLRVIGTHTDITERKRMEAALVDLNAHLEQKVAERTAELSQSTAELARTSERLELAMQVTSDGVWDCNMQTEKVYCNANYFAMLGYGPDELGDDLDAVFTDLLPPEEREAIAESISQRFASEGGHESEFRMRAKDGSYRWIYARGRVIERDAQGQPLRAIGTHVDITVRKKAEEALQDLNATLEQKVDERTAQLAEAKAAAEAAARAKSEFLANMSHEIRTPMNAILGLTQILERDPLTPDQHDMLQKIGDSGAGLLHIINDILDFSKIEAGQLKVERCAFELSSVLNKVESLMTASAGAKSLGLRVEPPAGLPGPVIGDPLRIQQILLNLVGNAIKFTEQGAVTVRVLPLALTETTVRLRFEVSDTGIGIAPAPLAKLFQPFTQADASTTRRFGGTGLGLSICKRLVELMGGTIGATSEPGLGSTFWFELPFERTATAAASADEASTTPAPAGPRLQGLRVLAVDDNRINLFMLERALKLEGVSRVQLAADGQQALQTLEADPQGFDCVLMDVQMPVMDGLTATRLIREHPELQTLPVIALTAGVMAEERERAEAAGVTGFLAKPLELAAMVTMLRPYAPEPAVDASPPQRNTP